MKQEKKVCPRSVKNYLKFAAKQPSGCLYQEAGVTYDKASCKTSQAQPTKQQLLNTLKAKYRECTSCPLAKQGRSNVVFGHGNPNATLMFVGEGPGRDEDLQALPFVGRAGKLLTKILQAMGLEREDVYISNIVKCRPPNNRAPLPNESQTCKSQILFEEMKIIQPKIICTLGATATRELLEQDQPQISQTSISKIRGTFIPFKNTLVMPTFHPAYLLRNPNKKREVWIDMQKIMEKLKSYT